MKACCVGQHAVAGIDQTAVHPEDGAGVGWEILTRFLGIEGEDSLHAKSGQEGFLLPGNEALEN